jgi:hypothetical protein
LQWYFGLCFFTKPDNILFISNSIESLNDDLFANKLLQFVSDKSLDFGNGWFIIVCVRVVGFYKNLKIVVDKAVQSGLLCIGQVLKEMSRSTPSSPVSQSNGDNISTLTQVASRGTKQRNVNRFQSDV